MIQNLRDFFTDESNAAFEEASAALLAAAEKTCGEYFSLVADVEGAYPAAMRWREVLTSGTIVEASEASLWSDLRSQDLFQSAGPSDRSPTGYERDFRVISSKAVDLFWESGGFDPFLAYTFLRLRVFNLGAPSDEIKERVSGSGELEEPVIIDFQVHEMPPGRAHDLPGGDDKEEEDDVADDREKLHFTLMVGKMGDGLKCLPVYIGVGTGEPYGLGPKRSKSEENTGRWRFYKVDRRNTNRMLWVAAGVSDISSPTDIQALRSLTAIEENFAELVLARCVNDSSAICLSDPMVDFEWELRLEGLARLGIEDTATYSVVKLSRESRRLPVTESSVGFDPDDIPRAVDYAWRHHHHSFVAWQHPMRIPLQRLAAKYLKKLPLHRRQQYEIRRFKPEVFQDRADGLTLPEVLSSPERVEEVRLAHRDAPAWFEEYYRDVITRDLYGYGSHPELRLRPALAFWTRVFETGLQKDLTEAAYECRLDNYEVEAAALVG